MLKEKAENLSDKPKNRLDCIPILQTRGTHFSVGYSIGRMFKSMITDMLKSWDYFNNTLWKLYCTEDGKEIYQKCLIHCTERFPNYVDEIRGMAEGSEIEFEKLFLLNIDSIITASDQSDIHGETGCTSIICNKEEIILGHTEDAMCEILNNVYIVSAEIVDESGKKVEKFTTFSYAGHLSGYTMGFNEHGMVHSVNSLFPANIHKTGTPRSFIARSILVAQNMEQLLNTLRDTGSGISDGFSLNVIFSNEDGQRNFYNIEILPPTPDKDASILDIIPIQPGESYIHCNKYLRVSTEEKGLPVNASSNRHSILESLIPPEGLKDVKVLLSDQSDSEFPIFICDKGCLKLSHVRTVAVGIFDLDRKNWSIYLNKPMESEPIAVIPMNFLAI